MQRFVKIFGCQSEKLVSTHFYGRTKKKQLFFKPPCRFLITLLQPKLFRQFDCKETKKYCENSILILFVKFTT